MSLAVVISIIGVIQVLIAVAVVVFLILGLQWLAAKVGFVLPQPMWAVLGFILILLVLLFALGVFGGGGVSFR
jgi:hypothetical protein